MVNLGNLGGLGSTMEGMLSSPEGQDQIKKFISSPEGKQMLVQFVSGPEGKQLAGQLLMPILQNLQIPDNIKDMVRQYIPA
jgi:hypothetical protein